VTLADVTDDSGDDVLEARPLRIRRWHVVAIGAAVAVLASLQVARHASHHDPVARPPASAHPAASASPTPPGRVIEGQALLSYVVGSRCPTSVVCGIGSTVSAGMAAEFRADFPDATISMQASAFDAGAPKTYWEQISATSPDGVTIVLTEQRILRPATHASTIVVNRSLDGGTASYTKTRGAWRMMANLNGRAATLPVTAARHWVSATPPPR
jgi:hypothetical protein